MWNLSKSAKCKRSCKSSAQLARVRFVKLFLSSSSSFGQEPKPNPGQHKSRPGSRVYPFIHRHDGVVVRTFASQSVDLGFIPLVESYQKTLKDGIHSFPAWRSAFRGFCGEQAGKFASNVLGQSV